MIAASSITPDVAALVPAAPTDARLPRWLANVFTRKAMICAWVVLLIAGIHPPHETGLQLCWLHASTGIPCPGCGLIRSLACAARGMTARSVEYHPFGIPVLVLFASNALLMLLPQAWRAVMQQLAAKHVAALQIVAVAFLSSLIAFGAWRALDHVIHYHVSVERVGDVHHHQR